MSATAISAPDNTASVGDFLALLKPRVMSLVIFTALAGIVAAPAHIHPMTAFVALLCIAVGAGAAGALNMAFDGDIDALMARTVSRPIPQGRIAREDALAFGWTLAVGSVAVMWLFVNALAASLLAFTVLFYAVVYTLWLKRVTPQNIVIGGLAGALPPAIGWAAVTDTITLAPLSLVAIIFLWTPPHFWALSLWRSDDYARAGVPMLPVVRGKRVTRVHITAYSLLLLPAGMLPALIGVAGALYAFTALLFGLLMVGQSFRVLGERDLARESQAHRLFGLSLFYIFALFMALIVERAFGFEPLHAWM